MATQTAVPGAVVSIGSLFSPGGAQGIPGSTGPVGPQGPSGSGTGDMLKSVYDTNSDNIVDHAALADNATNATNAAAVPWTGVSGKPSTFPPDSSAMLKSIYDTNNNGVVDTCDSLPYSNVTGTPTSLPPSGSAGGELTGTYPNPTLAVTAIQPTIWSVRLRSFNSVGNPNFEVDQVNCNAVIANAANGARVADRWIFQKGGTMTVTTQATNNQAVAIPGTSYVISGTQLSLQLTTQQTTLGAGDLLALNNVIEGPAWRELKGDVHSISLLCYSTVAPLTFAVAVRDFPTTTKSLVKTATISTPNVWTLVTLPNLPIFPAGNFSQNPGSPGYALTITLACGSTYVSPSPGVWVSGNYISAAGVGNWCANPINSTVFYCAMAQHEPGPVCSTLMDKPFVGANGNLEECLRYYQKTYKYNIKPGTSGFEGNVITYTPASQQPYAYIPFKKVMAKAPTITGFSGNTGASNNVYDNTAAVDRAISSQVNVSDSGFCGFTVTAMNGAAALYQYHYTADSGM